MGVRHDPFSSVILICSNTGDGLTRWMGVHPFLSVILIFSKTGKGLTFCMGIHQLLSVVLICSNTGEDSLPGWVFICSCQLFCSAQRDSHTGWVFTHSRQQSDLLKHWRGTHKLGGCSHILVSNQICLNTGEVLTPWMGVHPFMSAVRSSQTQEMDSLPG